MIKKLFRWLGYVPERELAEALHEKRVHAAAEEQLQRQIEDLRCELQGSNAALNKANTSLGSHLAQMGKKLSPLVSVRRAPQDLRRWRVQLDIEFDLFERIVFDYQLKRSSVDFEFLMDSLFYQIRNDFMALLRLGASPEER